MHIHWAASIIRLVHQRNLFPFEPHQWPNLS